MTGPMTYAALKAAGVAVLGWGQFVTVLINFLILAFIIFLIVRSANRMKKKAEDAAPGARSGRSGPAARDQGRAAQERA